MHTLRQQRAFTRVKQIEVASSYQGRCAEGAHPKSFSAGSAQGLGDVEGGLQSRPAGPQAGGSEANPGAAPVAGLVAKPPPRNRVGRFKTL